MMANDEWSVAQSPASSDGSPPDAPTPAELRAGSLLAGRYRILRVLGEGGQGRVLGAADIETGRDVAIKVPRAGRTSSRIAREAQCLDALRHANIIGLVQFVIVQQTPMVVMERVGETLSDLVNASPARRLPVSEVGRIGVQVFGALNACHRAGYVHRDVKPSNIAWAPVGTPAKLIDFGLATDRWRSRAGRMTAGLAGTARYASTRVLAGYPHTPLDDLWSLFYSLIHCLSGGLPWSRLADHEQIRLRQRAFEGPNLSAGMPAPIETMRRALRAAEHSGLPVDDSFGGAIESLATDGSASSLPVAWDPCPREARKARERMDAAASWRASTAAC